MIYCLSYASSGVYLFIHFCLFKRRLPVALGENASNEFPTSDMFYIFSISSQTVLTSFSSATYNQSHVASNRCSSGNRFPGCSSSNKTHRIVSLNETMLGWRTSLLLTHDEPQRREFERGLFLFLFGLTNGITDAEKEACDLRKCVSSALRWPACTHPSMESYVPGMWRTC